MCGLALVVWLRPGAVADANDAPGFVDVSSQAGIDHVYDGEFRFFVGGGIAVFDCDDDHFPDIYVAGGANQSGLYRNLSQSEGTLRFSLMPAATTDLVDVVGAYPIDVDNDAVTDLAVLRNGENVLLRGVGDCEFERANESWGIDGGAAWTTGFSAAWEAGEALPTLAFGNYLELDEAGNRLGTCFDNVLLRPDDRKYGDPASLAPGYCSLSVLFSDWARTGIADLRISNDRQYTRDGEEQLWRVAPGAEPELYDRSDGWGSLRIFGMGIASHDLTGDGYPEVFLTSMGDNKLQTLQSGGEAPIYSDIALDRGVTAHRPFTGDDVKPSTAWHAEFEDVNNDGYVDLYIAKGNVDAMVEAAADDPNNLLIGQSDGSFVEGAMESGLMNAARTRGAAVVDFDLDGRLDIIEVNRRTTVTVWHNIGADTGGWIQLRPTQQGVNRDAIGAWIEVRVGERTLLREVTIGGGHAGGQLGWVHFGLGASDTAQVRVMWPDGEVGGWMDVDAGTFSIVERGADQVRAVTP